MYGMSGCTPALSAFRQTLDGRPQDHQGCRCCTWMLQRRERDNRGESRSKSCERGWSAPDVPAAEVQLPPPTVFPGLALAGDRRRGAEATQGGAELVGGGAELLGQPPGRPDGEDAEEGAMTSSPPTVELPRDSLHLLHFSEEAHRRRRKTESRPIFLPTSRFVGWIGLKG